MISHPERPRYASHSAQPNLPTDDPGLLSVNCSFGYHLYAYVILLQTNLYGKNIVSELQCSIFAVYLSQSWPAGSESDVFYLPQSWPVGSIIDNRGPYSDSRLMPAYQGDLDVRYGTLREVPWLIQKPTSLDLELPDRPNLTRMSPFLKADLRSTTNTGREWHLFRSTQLITSLS